MFCVGLKCIKILYLLSVLLKCIFRFKYFILSGLGSEIFTLIYTLVAIFSYGPIAKNILKGVL